MLVYWLKSVLSNYVRSTKNLEKRIRQHNGVICGGAKCTQGRVWTPYKVVEGFQTWHECLSFEFHLERAIKKSKTTDEAFMELLKRHPQLSEVVVK